MARDYSGSSEYDYVAANLYSSAMAITGWFRADGNSSNVVICGVSDTTNYMQVVTETAGNDQLRFRIYANASGSNADTSNTWSTNTWHHFAAISNGLSHRSVLDGDWANSGTTSKAAESSPTHFAIGRRYYDTADFDGKVACVTVWSAQLPQAVVEALAAGVHPFRFAGAYTIAGHWELLTDDGQVDWWQQNDLSTAGSPAAFQHPPALIGPTVTPVPLVLPSGGAGGNVYVTTGAGAGSGTGSAPTVAVDVLVTTGAGSGTGSGATPTVAADVLVTAGAGSGTGAGAQPTPVVTSAGNVYVTTGAGSGTGSGAAPTVAADVLVTAGAGAGTATGAAPTVAADVLVTAGAGAGTATGAAPTVAADVRVATGPGTGTAAGTIPALVTDHFLMLGAGTATGLGAAPTVAFAPISVVDPLDVIARYKALDVRAVYHALDVRAQYKPLDVRATE